MSGTVLERETVSTNGAEGVLTTDELVRMAAEAPRPEVALSRIVAAVGNHFGCDVCSLYLLDRRAGELVLTATVGLRQDAIGKIRMRPEEGLVGLAAQCGHPVSVAEAQNHPRFKYFPEAGEEAFRSFLGVPLCDGDGLLGVLVVQTVEPREFEPEKVSQLEAAAERLAPVVKRLASKLNGQL